MFEVEAQFVGRKEADVYVCSTIFTDPFLAGEDTTVLVHEDGSATWLNRRFLLSLAVLEFDPEEEDDVDN